MSQHLVRISQRPELADQLGPWIDLIWPRFMKEDPIANRHWGRLFSDFPQCQCVLLDESVIVGTANSVPLSWDGAVEDLPDEGWDWALNKAMADADAGRQPAALVGLQIAIASSHQGRGLSSQIVQYLRGIAVEEQLKRLIIPVRPTHKHRYPLVPIERYIEWERDGLPFDPWLRVHVRAGGRIVKACTRAMTIRGTVGEWEGWTDMAFPDSGSYIVPQALVPVEVDRESDAVIYVEPNVWIEHRIA